MVRYNNKTWISAAESKYPGQFIYDKTNYIDSYHKVIVTCKQHNESFDVPPLVFIKSDKNIYCQKCKYQSGLKNIHNIVTIKHPLFCFDLNVESNILTTICPYHGKFFNISIDSILNDNLICPECIKEYNKSINGNYYLKFTHKETGICFVKVEECLNTDKYNNEKYSDFTFELLESFSPNNLKKFYLPNYVYFEDRYNLYELDGYHQLKVDQVKFIRDSLIEKQNGKCCICENNVDMPTLDHYHSKKQHGSGLVRGVICNTCNRMTGVVENNFIRNSIDYSDGPKFLRKLADYLENKRENYIHPSEKEKTPKLMKSSYNKLVKAVNGKQKIPSYSGKLTKSLEKLFEKHNLVPELKGSSSVGFSSSGEE